MKPFSFLAQNPIIVRSLRNRKLNWRMMAALGLAILAYCPVCLVISPYTLNSLFIESRDFFIDLAEVGTIVFNVTAIFMFVIVTLFAPIMSAGAIAGERQRQTLDLLLVTLLPTRSIVVGKLVSSLIYTILLIAVVWPVILFCLVIGGVTFIEIIISALLLLVTALAFTTIGLFVSSIGRTITNAAMLTYGLVMPAIFIAPPLVMLLITIALNFLSGGFFSDFEIAVNFYGWGLVLSLNPIGAAIYSAVLYAQDESVFWASVSFTPQQTYYLLSPWFIYIITYSVITLFLIQLTTRRLARAGE